MLLLLVMTITTFISCDKDPVVDDPNMVNQITISHTSDFYFGSISGQVVSENLEPLSGVNINILGEETSTDENGYFILRDIQLDAQGTVINASLDNYWTNTKMLNPSKAQQNETRIMLLPKTEVKSIESASGGTVNFNDAVKIDFPENVFVTSNGESYNGVVEVTATHIDPNDENFGLMSPGDFRAFSTESELQSLMSLGMAGVELRGSNNEVLELKSDMKATLHIKIPTGITTEEVPLWHFDEASGYWLEEGIAIQNDGFYVGEVSHFSWWNCDLPFSTVKLSGSVLDDLGNGISGLQVSIILEENMMNLGAAYTGNEGLFCGWIPKDENLILQIKNECGEVFYENAIGSFDEDANLPPVIITGQNIIEVCGNLVDCNSDPVTNGYLVVQHQGNKTFIPVDASGDFCSSVNICESNTFEVYGIDINTSLQGLASPYNIGDSDLNNLALTACDQSASLFTYQIDNETEIVITDFNISIDPDGVVGFGGSTEMYGVFPTVILDGRNWGTDDFFFGYFNIIIASATSEIHCDFASCNPPNVEVIEFKGVGYPIILQITGTSDQSLDYVINVNGILE